MANVYSRSKAILVFDETAAVGTGESAGREAEGTEAAAGDEAGDERFTSNNIITPNDKNRSMDKITTAKFWFDPV